MNDVIKGKYEELMDRLCVAQEELLKREIEANTVVINGKKYGELFDFVFAGKYYHTPSIFGMAIEMANLPNDYDFIVQYRMYPPRSEYDQLCKENEELKDKLNQIKEILGDNEYEG